MKRRLVLTLASLGTLTGCSMEYRVDAVFFGDRLTFVSDAPEKSVDSCSFYELTVAKPDGTILWKIERAEHDAHDQRCAAIFPLTYGRPPRSTMAVVNAKALTSGQTYVISGSGSGSFRGVFRYEVKRLRSLTNFAADAVEARQALDTYWNASGFTLEEATE